MRILHLGPVEVPVLHARGGAIQRRIRELSRAQSARGHSVKVLSADSTASTADFFGVEVKNIVCKTQGKLRTWEFLARIPRSEYSNADCVHFHSLPEGIFLCGNRNAETLLSFDYFRFRRGKATPLQYVYKNALNRFHRLLPVSEYCQREASAYWGLSTAKMKVLYNGVDTAQFSPDPALGREFRRKLNLEDRPIILYVGRICAQKGTDTLINAYIKVRESIPDLSLVVVGPAERFGTKKESDLISSTRKAGAVYIPPVHDDELPAVYNMCDVFVMPTRSEEMFGMAALEAQSCGKPIICTNHGGLPEVVHPDSGLFFSPGDPSALADCITKLFRDDALRLRMGMSGQHASARFAWSHIAEELDRIIADSRSNGFQLSRASSPAA
jgi:glycosyltransferase involved in cell wall biosynthesis